MSRGHLDLRHYAVLGFLGDRPIGISFHHFDDEREVVKIRMALETVDAFRQSDRCRRAAGRRSDRYAVSGSTTGRSLVSSRRRQTPMASSNSTECPSTRRLMAGHGQPASPCATRTIPRRAARPSALPADVVVTLPAGCVVTGTVTDGVTGQPAAGAVIYGRRVDEWGESFAADGRSRAFSARGAGRAVRFPGGRKRSRLRSG